LNVFFEKLKKKEWFFWMRKDFFKEKFVLKVVSNRRDKDKS
jgi:hypothetical protein